MWLQHHKEITLVLTTPKILFLLGEIERFDALFSFFKNIIIPETVLKELSKMDHSINFIEKMEKFSNNYSIKKPTNKDLEICGYDEDDFSILTESEIEGFTIAEILCKSEINKGIDFESLKIALEVDYRPLVELDIIASAITPINLFWTTIISWLIKTKNIVKEQAELLLNLISEYELYDTDRKPKMIIDAIKNEESGWMIMR